MNDHWDRMKSGIFVPRDSSPAKGNSSGEKPPEVGQGAPHESSRPNVWRLDLWQLIVGIVAVVVAVTVGWLQLRSSSVETRPSDLSESSITVGESNDGDADRANDEAELAGPTTSGAAPTTEAPTTPSESTLATSAETIQATTTTTAVQTTTSTSTTTTSTTQRPTVDDLATIEGLALADLGRVQELQGKWISMLGVWCYERRVPSPASTDCPALGETREAGGILNDIRSWQDEVNGIVASNNSPTSDFGFSPERETIFFVFDDIGFDSKQEAANWCSALPESVTRYSCAPWRVG